MRIPIVLCLLLAMAYAVGSTWYANVVVGGEVRLVEMPNLPYVTLIPAPNSGVVEVIVDPFSELIVKKVLGVDSFGRTLDVVVDNASSMKYVRIRVDGLRLSALLIVFNKGPSLSPVQPISLRRYTLNISSPNSLVSLNEGALWSDVLLTSLYDSRIVEGDYLLLYEGLTALSIGSEEVLVHVRKYRVFSRNFTVSLPARLSITEYANYSGWYYLALNFTGTEVLAIGEEASAGLPLFSPHQRVYSKLQSYVVISRNVTLPSPCRTLVERLKRGYRITVMGVEPYILQIDSLPFYLEAFNFTPRAVEYRDVLGNRLERVRLVGLREEELGCSPPGEYKVAVEYGGWVMDAIARVGTEKVDVMVPLDKPRVIAEPPLSVLINGSNYVDYIPLNSTIEVAIAYGNRTVFSYYIKMTKGLAIDVRNFTKTVRVVDAVGNPVEKFTVHAGGLAFEGRRGVALVVAPPNERIFRVEAYGATALSNELTVVVPVLADRTLFSIALASIITSLVLAILARGSREGVDVVEDVL